MAFRPVASSKVLPTNPTLLVRFPSQYLVAKSDIYRTWQRARLLISTRVCGNKQTRCTSLIADTSRTVPQTLRAVERNDEVLSELKMLSGFNDDIAPTAPVL